MARMNLVLLALALFAAVATATNTKHCSNGKIQDPNMVQIGDCKAPPCKLKKNTDVTIQYKFTPKEKVESLKVAVKASMMFGIKVPFVGVDGSQICDKIYRADNGQKVACPLAKDVEYIYKDSFPIKSYYPSLSTTVYWTLKNSYKTVSCFQVAANIA
ncbi:epididymal secretory protein E1-like [Trichogramma pretiosum]|uniref:epididymal secretory protein E1-like n=1 Tax=Trichogramma pretiosum TaxID=7493 RepID=UPI0006C965E5|nr:epididymal secretory protein E1-like [Trichogramma pretiosum]